MKKLKLMKKSLLFWSFLVSGITFGQATTGATIQYTNNSGKDLVIALMQGALSGQNANQVAWLKLQNGTYSWTVPSTPASNADLAPYIFDLKAGASKYIKVPAYSQTVGFRSLIAEPAFKSNAMQYLNITAKDSIAYMGFPDLNTASYIFDKFEAGLTIGTPGIWNITAVDFVALPMQLSCKGIKVGFKDGVTFTGLSDKLSALGLPYSSGKTAPPNTATTTYRFMSPSHISKLNQALDLAIKTDLPKLNSFTDSVAYGNYRFVNFQGSAKQNKKGDVTGTLTCNYTNTANGIKTIRSITVNDVTTAKSFSGEIVGAKNANKADSAAQVELGAILSAALCRGVTSKPNLWGDIVHVKTNCSTPWNYYPAGVQSNSYSKLIHSYSIDNKNYGFPYDDFFGDEAGFTAIPGDTINVTILPYSGIFTAKPNAQPDTLTGCLVATVPTSNIYPASTAWEIGRITVGKTRVFAGANDLCSLNSDSVVCTFSKSPGIAMHINMMDQNPQTALTFYQNGEISKQITGINGMVYDAVNRVLTFGNAASWTRSCPQMSLPISTVYPSGSGWKIGPIQLNDTAISAGTSQLCSITGDTAVFTFPSFPTYEMHLDVTGTATSALTFYMNGVLKNGMTIEGVSYNPETQTIIFGQTASWITNCPQITLPASTIYPSGKPWKIGPIALNGVPIGAGTSQLCSITADTAVFTFPSYPNYEMHLNLTGSGTSAFTFYKKGVAKPGMGIIGLIYDLPTQTLIFGQTAAWTGN